MERYLERYLDSVGLAVWRNMRYWMQRGYRYEDAIKKAIPLGLGMLRAAVGVTISDEDAEIMCRDIAAAYTALADVLQRNRINEKDERVTV